MRVVICGGRNFSNEKLLRETLDRLHNDYIFSLVIQGGATGADYLASLWAADRKIPCQEFKAEWDKYGKSAGFLRNQKMINEGKPKLVIAFPGGRGTADMIKRAEMSNIGITEVIC